MVPLLRSFFFGFSRYDSYRKGATKMKKWLATILMIVLIGSQGMPLVAASASESEAEVKIEAKHSFSWIQNYAKRFIYKEVIVLNQTQQSKPTTKKVEVKKPTTIVKQQPAKTDSTPVTKAPAKKESTPVTKAPAKTESTTPVTKAPAKTENTPVTKAPAKTESTTPVTKAPVKTDSTPVTKAPVKKESTPVTKAPAKTDSTPVTKAPVKTESTTPVTKAPAKTENTPVAKAPVKTENTQVATPKEETPTTNQSSTISAFEREVVELTNAERAKAGLKALEIDTALMANAREKSEDMRANAYFDHTSPILGTPFEQMKKRGITYKSAGENIAKGQTTPKQVVDAWMNSSGHRANIMSESFTHIGVGYVAGGHHWTQQFIKK